jgi:hypothetical protein
VPPSCGSALGDFHLAAAREDFDPARFDWRNAEGAMLALRRGSVTDAEDAAALAWLMEAAEAGDAEAARILVALMRWACGCAPPGGRVELNRLARRARVTAPPPRRTRPPLLPMRRPACGIRRVRSRAPRPRVRRSSSGTRSRAGPSDEAGDGEPGGEPGVLMC